MSREPSITRRHVLAAGGVATVGIGGYLADVLTGDSVPAWLTGRECRPSALATSPTDWPFPRHDRPPERAGPTWPLTQVWEREWPTGPCSSRRHSDW